MCKPHKALRMTVKVHLKTEEKKRAAAEIATLVVAAPVESPAPAVPAPAEPLAEKTLAQDEQIPFEVVNSGEDSAAPGATDPMDQVEEVGCLSKQELPSSSFVLTALKVSHENPQTTTAEDQSRPEETESLQSVVDADAIVQTTEGEDQNIKDSDEQQLDGQDTNEDQNAAGFDGSNGNFQNMDWNNANGFNPMMNMPNMQAGWGGFNNMMGMFPVLPKSTQSLY